ncbi:hypothetical protein N7520_005149 [Penicillium odoratum]|uniref:uncharacterized protein n=1 Tax=Penicillium odoratum TaxID=1167516 RepID=UPI002547B468|nr:uncharacterized protein N7520_005149 [Penicillium odoratum]KAJ5765590.1 hypothetical protein N7520_005149 [Penicillium odoratum]
MPVDHHDSDDEALFASLENEDEKDATYRTQRIQQLNAELAAQKDNRSANSNGATYTQDGRYPTLSNDQGVLDFTTSTTRCIVHFAHDEFTRCAIMDARLEELAGRHYEVKFARVDVRNTPFLAEKLNIRVLPCVIGFKDGVGVERVVGFEGLGPRGTDGTEAGFSVTVLEKRLLYKGVLMQAKFSADDEDEDEHQSEDDGYDVRKGSRLRKKAIQSGKVGQRGRYDDDDDEWD